MVETCRRFCLLTTGRSGSSSLMRAFQVHDDIVVPSQQIGFEGDELLLPHGFERHRRAYEQLLGLPIDGGDALIEAFYRYNAGMAFAGFKSMPHRHADFRDFVAREDIRSITLVRADVASTVASFMLALRQGTWGRRGEAPRKRWTFQPHDAAEARAILRRLQNNMRALAGVPAAIRLTFEDLCDPECSAPELDDYFGRPIRIADPRPPTSGASYTGNWADFAAALGLDPA